MPADALMEPTIAWWIWIVAGIALMAMEAVLPSGFYLFFIGVAAVGTGSLTWLGVVQTLFYQGIAALVCMGIVLALRNPVVAKLKLAPHTDVDSLVGETATAMEVIAPGATARIELRGTSWTGRNTGTTPIPTGAKCRVARVDGLTLEISHLMQ